MTVKESDFLVINLLKGICYYKDRKSAIDRRLVLNRLIKKVTKPFADGGYFFSVLIYSIKIITIIEITINTIERISKSLI